MAHKKGTVNNVVAHLSNYMVTPNQLAQAQNIVLDQAKQMLRVTTKRGIRAAVHPISRR